MSASAPVDEVVSGATLHRRALQSGYWIAGLRTAGRAIGFCRNVVLARLLSPDDIGVFGIALLVLSVLDRFSNTGLQAALIQKKGSIIEYLNNAFTLQVTRGVLLAVATFLAAPAVASFFDEPRAIALIQLLALSIVLRGLQNPAIVAFQRHLALQRQVILRFATTTADLVVSIALAIIMRSPMALMIGLVVGKGVGLLLSYTLHPYRPGFRLDWHQTRELGSYGRWVFLSNAIWFVTYRGDNLIVGKLLGPAALGIYVLAFRISEVVTLEVGMMLNDVAFPAYARMQDDLERVRRTFTVLTELVVCVALPMGVALAMIATPFTRAVLGERWLEVGTILPILALAGVIRSIVGSAGAALRGLGQARLAFLHMLVGVCAMYAVIFPLVGGYGLPGIAWACLVGMTAALPVAIWQVKSVLGMEWRVLARMFVPAVALSIAAALGPWTALRLFSGRSDVEQLIAAGLLAVAFIGVSAVALWRFWSIGPFQLIALRHGLRKTESQGTLPDAFDGIVVN